MDENINETDIDAETENTISIEEIRSLRSEIAAKLFILLVALGFIWAFTVPLLVETHKPAIYLYNNVPVSISIKLDKSIKYTNVIPSYKKKGWLVEADNSGFIRDLQPQYTNCNKLPYKKQGFEYSKEACKINKYPYIYWDGKVNKRIENKTKGFVVKKEDIYEFLNAKADELKLNENEKHEFVDYWTKQVKQANGKYFKISFIQNEEVDAIFPITVSPQPKSYNRIQIIIKKCSKNTKAEPQRLIPVMREGLTLVEWGGII